MMRVVISRAKLSTHVIVTEKSISWVFRLLSTFWAFAMNRFPSEGWFLIIRMRIYTHCLYWVMLMLGFIPWSNPVCIVSQRDALGLDTLYTLLFWLLIAQRPHFLIELRVKLLVKQLNVLCKVAQLTMLILFKLIMLSKSICIVQYLTVSTEMVPMSMRLGQIWHNLSKSRGERTIKDSFFNLGYGEF